ncbi:MAG: hypothetical protein KAR05_05735 [Candidatus Omnitrophica bacterium]|nr:hypothetical protein [Candidatus Omnitrophota bacterium]
MGLIHWFKSKMFGGEILRTIGVVNGEGQAFVKGELKVHVIKDNRTIANKVALEMVTKCALSYQIMPMTLSINEARKLIDLLNSACS